MSTRKVILTFSIFLSVPVRLAHAQTQTFNFVGQAQTWVVPSQVTSITINALGAQGGGNPSAPSTAGGKGGRVQTTLSVTPGETLVIYVGGKGGDLMGPNTAGVGGFNGGAAGGIDNVDANAPAAGGGGASDVRQGGVDLVHRVVVAGGGGGSECCEDANGGAGGGLVGAAGGTAPLSTPGGGGTQSNGGAGGTGCNGNGGSGTLGQGGLGGDGDRAGGGGGGGYYGGGGGGGCTFGSGGGGGSSYSAGTNTTHTQGYQSGSGQVKINWVPGSTTTLGPASQLSCNDFTSEPIDTATGNYYLSRTDLSLPGKGLSFNFTLTYNSLDSYAGPMGSGWTHSLNVFLIIAGGSVEVKEGDGHTASFISTGGGSYGTTTVGEFDTLAQNGDGSFTLMRKNRTKLNFSSTGSLTSVVDRNGNTQTLTYGSGNLISVVDTAGRTVTF